MESLVGYVVSASHGTKIQVPQSNQKERDAYARGKQIFYFRGGPYDFACASCHSAQGQRIRLQDLPDLTTADAARHAYGTRSEEHTSELQSLMRISYAVFCLKKK